MITPEQAAEMAPVLQGVLRGYITEIDKGPDPRLVKCDGYIDAASGRSRSFTGKSVYVTYLFGTMLKHDSCGDPGTRTIAAKLREADKDPDVVGHIIVAESGGGAANSVAELADAITACEKPVVALVDGIAASACIYAISYCDKILASHDMDMVGCIGTLIELSGYPKFHKDSDGYVTARIYADASTEKNGDYEAALEGNFNVIREQRLNPVNDRFLADIRANRPAVTDEQLTGRTFFAKDVIGTLIDGIGSFEDAVQAVLELAADEDPEPDSNSQTMEKNTYPNLQAIPALSEQVFDGEGCTTLQPNQLSDVEAALAELATLREQNTTLTSQLEEANQTIAQRDARINELQTSLDAAIERAENPAPENPAPSAQPESEGEGAEPAQDFESALAECVKFINK